jgi:hypothetical protein
MCFGGGSAPTPPPPPDPVKTIKAQTSANQLGQEGSLINQNTAYGSVSYTPHHNADGSITYTANSKLSAPQQELLGGGQAYGIQANKEANTLLKSAGDMYSKPQNFSDMAGGLTEKLLGQETSYLNPVFDRQKTQLEAKLANQGLQPDSPAFKAQMMDLERNQNSAITNFLTTAEPQAFNQVVEQYKIPLQTAGVLRGGGNPENLQGNITNTSAGQIGAVNAGGIINQGYQNQLQNYTNQANQSNNQQSGISNLLGSLAGPVAGIFGF